MAVGPDWPGSAFARSSGDPKASQSLAAWGVLLLVRRGWVGVVVWGVSSVVGGELVLLLLVSSAIVVVYWIVPFQGGSFVREEGGR